MKKNKLPRVRSFEDLHSWRGYQCARCGKAPPTYSAGITDNWTDQDSGMEIVEDVQLCASCLNKGIDAWLRFLENR